MERLTADLEAAAHPALDALTAQVKAWFALGLVRKDSLSERKLSALIHG